MIEVRVPDEQEGTKAVVRAWLKQVGEAVAENDPLVELETDKVAMEVAAPASGVLSAILVETGDVRPGALLGHIAPGEAARATPPPPALADPEHRLSPAVRKLVSESGIDPAGLPGSGAGLPADSVSTS